MFTRNQAVQVTTKHGIVVDGTIAETSSSGGPLPFYPDSTVTKYGNGSMGRTAWGYKVRAPIINADTLEPYVDGRGRPMFGIGYVETKFICAK